MNDQGGSVDGKFRAVQPSDSCRENRCPNPMLGPSEMDIRPVFEAAEFGDALTPALAEQEGRVREKAEGRRGVLRH